MTTARARLFVAAAIACLAAVLLVSSIGGEPSPRPAPPGPGELNLRGKFSGETASADAAALACLCEELAVYVEADGMKDAPEQRIKTGAAVEDLRVAARDARMRGESIGARQPAARDAIQAFLDSAAGTSGGPLTSESRARWVSAFRAISRAAADAAQ